MSSELDPLGKTFWMRMATFIQMHFRLLLIMEENTMNPDQTAPKSSLIWVHIVCNVVIQRPEH